MSRRALVGPGILILSLGLATGCDADVEFKVGACVDVGSVENGESLTVVDCRGPHDHVIVAITSDNCPDGTVRSVDFGAPDPDRPPLKYCLASSTDT